MKTLEKIKNKIRELNKNKNNILYWTSVGILVAIGIFVFITMIIQTQWVGITKINAPIIVWIIASPTIGVFFLPFILLLSYICWFIVSVGKPVTIKKVMNDNRSLYENEDILKSEYEAIYKELKQANDRKEQNNNIKIEELKSDIFNDASILDSSHESEGELDEE